VYEPCVIPPIFRIGVDAPRKKPRSEAARSFTRDSVTWRPLIEDAEETVTNTLRDLTL